MNPQKVPTSKHGYLLADLIKDISRYVTEKYEEVGHIARITHSPPKEPEFGVYGRPVLPGTNLMVRYCTFGVIQADFMPPNPIGAPVDLMKSNQEAATSMYVQLRVASGCCKQLWEDTLVWKGLADTMLEDKRPREEVVKEFVDVRLWGAIVDRTHTAVDRGEGTYPSVEAEKSGRAV